MSSILGILNVLCGSRLIAERQWRRIKALRSQPPSEGRDREIRGARMERRHHLVSAKVMRRTLRELLGRMVACSRLPCISSKEGLQGLRLLLMLSAKRSAH